ncbi:hypothetical protein MMPV_003156 [Pyropia vietnamensis]
MTTPAFLPLSPPLRVGRPPCPCRWVAGGDGPAAVRRWPRPARREAATVIAGASRPSASSGQSTSSGDDANSGDALAAEFAALVSHTGADAGPRAGAGADTDEGASGLLSSAMGGSSPLTPEELASVDAIESMGLAELNRLSSTLQSSLAALDKAVASGAVSSDAPTIDDLDPDAVIRGAAASSSALSASAAADLTALLARFDARKAALLESVAADRAAIAEEVERLRELADGRSVDATADVAADADATRASRKRGLFRAAAAALAAAAVAYAVSGVAAVTGGGGGGGEELRNGAIDAIVAAVFAWLASREAPAAGGGEGGDGGDG